MTRTAPPTPAATTPAPAAVRTVQRRTLAVVAASTLVVLAAFVTPLATAVATARELGAGPGGQAWLLSAMSVGLAAALLVAGAGADDVGRRRVFTAGLVLLAAGAGLTAAAGSTGVFVAGRLVQGVGGAAVLACSLGLLAQVFPLGPPRARAAAVWGASLGAGTGVGGLAAVVLDGDTGWRATHAVTAAATLALAVAARLLLPESPRPRRPRVDVAGPVLLVSAVCCLLVGLVAPRSGAGTATGAALLAAGVLLAAGFVLAEARVRAPMVDLALFRVRGFVAANVGALVTGAATVGLMSYLATVLQRGLGESLLATTVPVVVWSGIATATSWGLRWVPALDGRLLLAGGLAVSAAGLAALAVLDVGDRGTAVLPGLVVLGVGYGAANAALGREAVAHVPAERAAMGSGANNTARYLGAAVGATLVVLLVTAAAPGGAGATTALLDGWDAAALAAAGLSAAGALAVLALRPARRAA
ncbi:Predicted arabinose efflux permease, MFS family [Geodermatophilus telluris]|uniref:Predicted arabinose efflux permease, MFS family n=1 Tax=Geodermatophilus telluris TaxID=1190417 RepID=A0A1G6VPW8_9ACTN|nr:MFS transporter [Geodermatophilus telluris]SDD55584.1 Predicted arabinose efflux permease, MFS family [Geodermatophilus telluris]